MENPTPPPPTAPVPGPGGATYSPLAGGAGAPEVKFDETQVWASRSRADSLVPEAASAEVPEKFDFLSPPQAPDEMGRLGSYRILKVLGVGGMGVVFQAEDPLLKRPVAVKAMLPEVAIKPANRQRFLRE